MVRAKLSIHLQIRLKEFWESSGKNQTNRHCTTRRVSCVLLFITIQSMVQKILPLAKLNCKQNYAYSLGKNKWCQTHKNCIQLPYQAMPNLHLPRSAQKKLWIFANFHCVTKYLASKYVVPCHLELLHAHNGEHRCIFKTIEILANSLQLRLTSISIHSNL